MIYRAICGHIGQWRLIANRMKSEIIKLRNKLGAKNIIWIPIISGFTQLKWRLHCVKIGIFSSLWADWIINFRNIYIYIYVYGHYAVHRNASLLIFPLVKSHWTIHVRSPLHIYIPLNSFLCISKAGNILQLWIKPTSRETIKTTRNLSLKVKLLLEVRIFKAILTQNTEV
jgi:hypothetical protein